MTSVLFVCTANRFRSPLAEAVFRSELQKSDKFESWKVGSAGTWADPGLPAMQDAIQAATELGLDLTLHRSRLINARLISQYSLTLVMQSGHKEALSVEFPDLLQRVYLLSEAIHGTSFDIPDPYVTEESPVEIAREIVKMVRGGWRQICELALQLELGKS